MGVRYRIDPPADDKHVCELPKAEDQELPAKTLVQCDECYAWHILDNLYADSLWIGLGWSPVRWYDFKARRQIYKFLAETEPPSL